MTVPLLPLDRAAVFSDFDGTLVPIAATPDGVVVPPELASIAQRLSTATGGAFALVTGRSLDDLSTLFNISELAAAGAHGAQWQNPVQRTRQDIGSTEELFRDVRAPIYEFAERHSLLLEDKRFALAIHFRSAPEKQAELDDFLQSLLAPLDDLKLVCGKCVREIKPVSVNKGVAIQRFMQEAPFAGRTPYFLGDDTTDEDGFRWVNANDGLSIKIGEGDTEAHYRLKDCSSVLDFLRQLSQKT